MDRRSFFKTIMTTSLLTPVLLASKSIENELDLYLISDDPHTFLPTLLGEVGRLSQNNCRTFNFLDNHPQKAALIQSLTSQGWRHEENPKNADLTLSYSYLQQHALPSFTLVKNGRIQDIRSWKLLSLWEKMKGSGRKAYCLTTVSLRNRQADHYAGEKANLFRNGQQIGSLSLNKNTRYSVDVAKGKIIVEVHNHKARILDSCCHGRICLYSPPVWQKGERIICAPNRFLLTIEGGQGVDTIIG